MLGTLHPGLSYAPTFVPTDIGSIVALYEPANIVHSGAPVTAWNDSSGHSSANLNAGTGGTFVSNAGNGLAGVSFDGSTQYLSAAGSPTVRSYWVVFGSANTASVACLCGAGRVYAALGTANCFGVFANTFVSSGQVYNTGRHQAGGVIRAANDIDFYLDGAMVNKTNGSVLYPNTVISMADQPPGQPTLITVQMMALFSSALNALEVAQMQDYATRIYGV